MPYKNLEITSIGSPKHKAQKKSQFYRGFSTTNPSNRNTEIYDFELVKQDIINHFNTRKGSRVMNPEFGTIIWDIIMEPMTPQLKEMLFDDIRTICNFDVRVYPDQIKISEYEKGYLVEITLILKNTDQSEVLKLAFDQKIGLRVQ